MIILLVQQRLAQPQLVQRRFVGLALPVFFEDGLAEHLSRHLLFDRQIVGVDESAIVVHRRVDRQALLRAEQIVVQAVARSDMHETAARGIINKRVARIQPPRSLAEWMLILEFCKVPAIKTADDLVFLPAALLSHRRQQHR